MNFGFFLSKIPTNLLCFTFNISIRRTRDREYTELHGAKMFKNKKAEAKQYPKMKYLCVN